MSKQQQTSDWGAEALTDAQMDYAASDVLYLHQLKAELEARLRREDRLALAQRCFRLSFPRGPSLTFWAGMTRMTSSTTDFLATGRRVIQP